MNKMTLKWLLGIPVNPEPKPEEKERARKIARILKVAASIAIGFAVYYAVRKFAGLNEWWSIGIVAGLAFGEFVIRTM